MIYLSRKNIFRRKHPKYDDFIIIGELPKKFSIVSSIRSENFFSRETLYIWISIQKKIQQKFLMPNK